MNLINKQFKTGDNNIINYYEIDNGNPTLLIIHAQTQNMLLQIIENLKMRTKENPYKINSMMHYGRKTTYDIYLSYLVSDKSVNKQNLTKII